jgi:predicted anti-sigma-YlaC factor YlaD
MDCSRSIELLSEYHDGTLDREVYIQVRAHLSICPPCTIIFEELDVIVIAASSLQTEPGIAFPDEEAIWQRLKITRDSVH